MSYTMLAVLGVLAAVAMDRWVLRTELTSSRIWWTTYAIVVAFQLLTNGWLTGRGIVRYDGAVIVGSDHVTWLGNGRLLYAPVEDLGFGFALILSSCMVWERLRVRSEAP